MHEAWFVIFLISAVCSVAGAQTADELSMRLAPTSAYTIIFPDIVVIPRFDIDGQVCEMSIQRQTNNIEDRLDPSLPMGFAKEIVDIVVPTSERGKSLNGREWDGVIRSTGVITTIDYRYENISIHVVQTSEDATPRLSLQVRSCRFISPERPSQTVLLGNFRMKEIRTLPNRLR
jgi:hypothetical protein